MAREERVTFQNKRGQKLVGILHHPAAREPQSAVILCHGMESSKGEAASRLTDKILKCATLHFSKA